MFHSIVNQFSFNKFDLLIYVAALRHVINNGPITVVSFSPDDWAATTPSAVLIGSLVITDKLPEKLLQTESYTVKAYGKRPILDQKVLALLVKTVFAASLRKA